jgi:hypothetical protein
MESFFASLKKKRVHHADHTALDYARAGIFGVIKAYFNRVGWHSTGPVSPINIQVPNARSCRRSAASSPILQRDLRHWRAGVCPADAPASARDRAPRHQHSPPACPNQDNCTTGNRGTLQNPAWAVKLFTFRRLPYALHRLAGTVPAVCPLAARWATRSQPVCPPASVLLLSEKPCFLRDWSA